MTYNKNIKLKFICKQLYVLDDGIFLSYYRRSYDGDTAVHAAANGGNTRILNLLVEAGGDLRLHDRQGLTARDWARKLNDTKKRKNIIDFIEKRRSTALTNSGVDLLNLSLHSQ